MRFFSAWPLIFHISPKCIGGLCWAITASDVAVEIDILFEENMDLGRKMFVIFTFVS